MRDKLRTKILRKYIEKGRMSRSVYTSFACSDADGLVSPFPPKYPLRRRNLTIVEDRKT